MRFVPQLKQNISSAAILEPQFGQTSTPASGISRGLVGRELGSGLSIALPR